MLILKYDKEKNYVTEIKKLIKKKKRKYTIKYIDHDDNINKHIF